MSSVVRGCRALFAPAKVRSAASAGTGAAAPASPKLEPKPKAQRILTRPTGIQKPQKVSPSLGSFLGASEASRAEAVKQIWAHIKLNNLQNPANKKEIICDSKLKSLFDGRDKVNFLEISKFLSPHFIKTQ